MGRPDDWISVSLDTEMIVLDPATSDSEIHSSADYTVVDSVAVVLGDLDGDGMVTFADIPLFINALISGDFVAAADTDESGQVDFADIPAFISLLQG